MLKSPKELEDAAKRSKEKADIQKRIKQLTKQQSSVFTIQRILQSEGFRVEGDTILKVLRKASSQY